MLSQYCFSCCLKAVTHPLIHLEKKKNSKACVEEACDISCVPQASFLSLPPSSDNWSILSYQLVRANLFVAITWLESIRYIKNHCSTSTSTSVIMALNDLWSRNKHFSWKLLPDLDIQPQLSVMLSFTVISGHCPLSGFITWSWPNPSVFSGCSVTCGQSLS